MAKMIEVAKATGLSLSTVSEILNGKPGYNEATRAVVLDASKKLNYRPNLISRALNGGKSMSIGLFFNSTVNALVAASHSQAIIETAARANYRVYTTYPIHRTQKAFDRECLAIISDMLARQVDGMIFRGSSQPAVRAMVQEKRLPAVYIDANLNHEQASIAINRAAGITQAAHHLRELGHRDIGLAVSAGNPQQPHLRLNIYRDALVKAGLKPVMSPDWSVPPVENSEQYVFDFITRQAKAGALPTALMIQNDEHAVAALSALHHVGCRIPQDISLIGFDDVSFARFTHPPLTTIQMPGPKVGQTAMQMLLRLMQPRQEGAEEPPPSASFETKLVIRQTTGPAPATAFNSRA